MVLIEAVGILAPGQLLCKLRCVRSRTVRYASPPLPLVSMVALHGDSGAGRQSSGEDEEEAEDEEEEFSVGRGRRWQTVGSRGGRYG